MDMLEFYRGELLLARRELGDRAIEIGRALRCDIVIDDAGLEDRHWLVLRKHGTAVAYDVSGGKRQRAVEYPLPLARAVPLSQRYSLKRVHVVDTENASPREPRTEALQTQRLALSRLVLLVGRGPEA